ncbi:MAG TPA: DJ-1/PfpI family protein [Candidatus Kapabacteria bacterium]|nr:DJ-1/PfpI family protein [Candidatus Kapabacteria bacterium]
MNRTILVPIANGSEDMETIISIDILRRASYKVILTATEQNIELSKGTKVICDILFQEIDSSTLYDGIVLPGGFNGVNNLLKNEQLLELIRFNFNHNKLIAAICAAPLILDTSQILTEESHITSHPIVKERLLKYNYKEESIVLYNNILTARGAGNTFDFAFAILNYFGNGQLASQIASSIQYQY